MTEAPDAPRFVYITTSSEDEARRIGRALVEERLAACVNIVPRIQSMYWWEGKIEESTEAMMIAKSRERLVPRLIERVRALHSYTVPAVVALPILAGNPSYLDWLQEETRT